MRYHILLTRLVDRLRGCLFVFLSWTPFAMDDSDWSLWIRRERVNIYNLISIISAVHLNCTSVLQIKRASLFNKTISLGLKLLKEIKTFDNFSIKQVSVLWRQYHQEVFDYVFQELKVWHCSVVFLRVVVFVNVIVIVSQIVLQLLSCQIIKVQICNELIIKTEAGRVDCIKIF